MDKETSGEVIRVMIVDDSFVARRVLEEGLQRHKDIEVVAAVADPFRALEKMEAAWPDVVVLDVEKQKMAGIAFLRQIMSTRPLPVVICSNLAQAGAEVTIQALQLGAFAIIPKPKLDVSEFLDVAADDLAGIIRVAAFSKNQRLISSTSVLRSSTKMIKSDPQTQRVVVIGCSSVGAQGLESILGRIPHSAPGILVAHQMPRELVNAYAESLNQELALSVQVAESGDMIQSGHVYLAPGGKQLLVERDGSVFRCMVKEASTSAEPCRFADGLFQSAAREFGAHATGFVLDDMGGDALWGLKALQEAGAATYAQGDGAMFGTALEPTSAGSPTKLVLLEDIPLILSGSP